MSTISLAVFPVMVNARTAASATTIKLNLATVLALTMTGKTASEIVDMIYDFLVTAKEKSSGRRSLSEQSPTYVLEYNYKLRGEKSDMAEVQSQVQTQLADTSTVATQLKLTESVALAAAATPALAETTLASVTTAAAALSVTSAPTTTATAYTGTTYTTGKAKKLKKKCKNKKTWCSSVQKDSKGKCMSYQGTAARKIKKKFCKGHCKKRCVEFLASAQAASG